MGFCVCSAPIPQAKKPQCPVVCVRGRVVCVCVCVCVCVLSQTCDSIRSIGIRGCLSLSVCVLDLCVCVGVCVGVLDLSLSLSVRCIQNLSEVLVCHALLQCIHLWRMHTPSASYVCMCMHQLRRRFSDHIYK